MSIKIKKIVAGLALAFSTTLALANQGTSSVEGFDFNYTVDLARDSKLVQAFDDGDRVYLQFSTMDELPSVYVEKDGKRTLAKLESKPPYLISIGLAQKFILLEGKKETIIKYVGKRTVDPVKPADAKVADAKPAEAKPAEAKAADGKPVEAKPADTAKAAEKGEKKPAKRTAKTSASDNGDEAPAPRRSKDRDPYRDDSRGYEREGARQDDDSYYESRRAAKATLLNVPFFENSITIGKLVRQGIEQNLGKINRADRVVIQGRSSVDGDYATAKARSVAIRSLLEDLGVDYDRIEVDPITVPKVAKTEGFYQSEILLMPEGVGGEYADRGRMELRTSRYVDRSLKIKSGDLLSEKLGDWAKANGYTLYWEADQYRATADFTTSKDFDLVLDTMKKSMAMNGVKLDISIYENHIVRIVEVK